MQPAAQPGKVRGKARASPTTWNLEETLSLCRCKVKEAVRLGQMCSRGKNQSSADKWQLVFQDFKASYKSEATMKTLEQIKNKWENLNKECRIVEDYQGMTGVRDDYFSMSPEGRRAAKTEFLSTLALSVDEEVYAAWHEVKETLNRCKSIPANFVVDNDRGVAVNSDGQGGHVTGYQDVGTEGYQDAPSPCVQESSTEDSYHGNVPASVMQLLCSSPTLGDAENESTPIILSASTQRRQQTSTSPSQGKEKAPASTSRGGEKQGVPTSENTSSVPGQSASDQRNTGKRKRATTDAFAQRLEAATSEMRAAMERQTLGQDEGRREFLALERERLAMDREATQGMISVMKDIAGAISELAKRTNG